MMELNYRRCTFEKSAAQLAQCPPSDGEVAFVGRSNAGKSSALNYLTGAKIARTSKTPGRTQLINFFRIKANHDVFLVDLPGYGYAKVDKGTRAAWHEFIDEYLRGRESIKGIVIVMDIRHPFKEIDVVMLDYCHDAGLPAHIILTKADKLSKNQQRQTWQKVVNTLEDEWENASAQLFSATKKAGADALSEVLTDWLNVEDGQDSLAENDLIDGAEDVIQQ